MRKDELDLELENLFRQYLESLGLELVEFSSRYQGRGLVLRILADRPEGGISLEECAGLNRKLGELLDEKDLLQESYLLEVSSPGLDRPLKAKGDFRRALGKQAKFFLFEAVNGKIEHDGLIKEVNDEIVAVQTEKGLFSIPLSKINKAKLII